MEVKCIVLLLMIYAECFLLILLFTKVLPFMHISTWAALDSNFFVGMLAEKLQVMFQGNFSFFFQHIKARVNFGVPLQCKDLNFILYLKTEEMCGYGVF